MARWAVAAGKVLLVALTLLCLASMGGAMLVAVWMLVPLHWLAGRDSSPLGTAGWALLAGLSAGEAAWMLGYLAAGAMGANVAAVVVLGLTSLGFVVARTRRLPRELVGA